MSWFDALIMGMVQGFTEFLPISSDGHLSVTEKALAALSGRPLHEDVKLFFIVMLHLGTLAAIFAYYWSVGLKGAKGLLGSTEVPVEFQRASVIKAGLLACLTTLPAIPVGLFLKKPIEAAFDSLTAAAIGFVVTAIAIGTTLRLKGGDRELSKTTWVHALILGTAQAIAILPGVSRSGMTISTALALGFTRPWAVSFSLLMAVPAILGAGILEIKDVNPKVLTPDFVGPLLAGVVVAGLVGYLAIIWLVKLVRAGKMWIFSIYLIVLALGLFAWILKTGASADVHRTALLDRPQLVRPDAGSRPKIALERVGNVDRPDARLQGQASQSLLRRAPQLYHIHMG